VVVVTQTQEQQITAECSEAMQTSSTEETAGNRQDISSAEASAAGDQSFSVIEEEMKTIWKSSESQRNYKRILYILGMLFEQRRRWLYSSAPRTEEMRSRYPALFFRDAFVHEFGMIVNKKMCYSCLMKMPFSKHRS